MISKNVGENVSVLFVSQSYLPLPWIHSSAFPGALRDPDRHPWDLLPQKTADANHWPTAQTAATCGFIPSHRSQFHLWWEAAWAGQGPEGKRRILFLSIASERRKHHTSQHGFPEKQRLLMMPGRLKGFRWWVPTGLGFALMFSYFNHVKDLKTLFPSISDAFHWITPVASVLSSPFDGCGRAPRDLSHSHGAVSMKGNSPDQKPCCPRAHSSCAKKWTLKCNAWNLQGGSSALLSPAARSILWL